MTLNNSILVTTSEILGLEPCDDFIAIFLKHYSNFSGTIDDFLELPHITYKDKCSVYFRMVPKDIASLVVADIAESVLHVFESGYLDDNRPRLAIEAARGGMKGEEAAGDASDAAYCAIHFASHAVAAAAKSACAAAYASTYAVNTVTAYVSAATHAVEAAGNRRAQEALQLEIMGRYLKAPTK